MKNIIRENKIISGIIAIILIISSWFGYQQLGGAYISGSVDLMGSAANLVSAPKFYVYANSTTTDPAQPDGGFFINQLINTEGIETGLLCSRALGGTTSTTLNVLQMGSYDGTNFFDVGSSTTNFVAPTTTLTLDPRTVLTLEPGTATTTGKCFAVNVNGYKSTRFIIYGDDLATDVTDGAQAYIYFNVLDKVTR